MLQVSCSSGLDRSTCSTACASRWCRRRTWSSSLKTSYAWLKSMVRFLSNIYTMVKKNHNKKNIYKYCFSKHFSSSVQTTNLYYGPICTNHSVAIYAQESFWQIFEKQPLFWQRIALNFDNKYGSNTLEKL